uniref:Core-binding (CB) domain-containing protein n=1 Tax=Clytia hemisphaerica TaxID=252671 RepID=A0A7M5WZD9_9CNID
MSSSYGRLVNDSPEIYANCVMKRERIGDSFALCLFVKKDIDIEIGTELRYDYCFGLRTAHIDTDAMPWRLNEERYGKPCTIPVPTTFENLEAKEETVKLVHFEVEYRIGGDGTVELDDGEAELIDGKTELNNGEAELNNGEADLNGGKAELIDEETELNDGVAELNDGELEFNSGKAELNDEEAELITVITELIDGETELIDGKSELNIGEAELNNGEAEPNSGKAELIDEVTELNDGVAELNNRESEVNSGKAELNGVDAELNGGEAELIDDETITEVEQVKFDEDIIPPTPDKKAFKSLVKNQSVRIITAKEMRAQIANYADIIEAAVKQPEYKLSRPVISVRRYFRNRRYLLVDGLTLLKQPVIFKDVYHAIGNDECLCKEEEMSDIPIDFDRDAPDDIFFHDDNPRRIWCVIDTGLKESLETPLEGTKTIDQTSSRKSPSIIKAPSKRCRTQKMCPHCNTIQSDLPKHVRIHHKWTNKKSKNVVGLFGLRTVPPIGKNKKRIRKACPFPDCFAITKNPGEHLRGKTHNKKSSDDDYKTLLKLFKPYDPNLMAVNWKGVRSPTKSQGLLQKSNVTGKSNSKEDESDLESDLESDDDFGEGVDSDSTHSENFSSPNLSYDNSLPNFSGDRSLPNLSEDPSLPNLSEDRFSADMNRDTSNISALLDKFQTYMTGPYRGRDSRSVKTVRGDVERAFRVIGVKTVYPLISDDKLLLSYIQQLEANKNLPGTIKTYLSSLIDFLQFLSQDKSHQLNVLEIVRTEKMLIQWRKKFNKKDRIQSHVRRAQDKKMLVTREQVRKYDEGRVKAQANKFFEMFRKDPDTKLRRSVATALRNDLIVEVGLANAHRSGVSIQMKIDEFNGHHFADGFYKVPVWDHKTIASYGPAPVHLRPTAFENFRTYVNIIRPKLNPNSDEVILTWSGGPMQSSDPSKVLHAAWKKSGIFDGQQIPKKLVHESFLNRICSKITPKCPKKNWHPSYFDSPTP